MLPLFQLDLQNNETEGGKVRFSLVPPGNVGGLDYVNFFGANTLADASTTAQTFSTMFQVPVQLVVMGEPGPGPIFQPGSQGGSATLLSGVQLK